MGVLTSKMGTIGSKMVENLSRKKSKKMGQKKSKFAQGLMHNRLNTVQASTDAALNLIVFFLQVKKGQ